MTSLLPSFLRRTTPAVALMAGIALLAGTGGAVAGGMITGAQIKNGTVTGADVKNLSLTTQDLRSGTLLASDLRPSAQEELQAVSAWRVVSSTTGPLTNNTNANRTATCPEGTKVLGTAAYWSVSRVAPQVVIANDGQSITAYSTNTSGGNDTMYVQAVCGHVVPAS
ncbi:hypothetical protein [Nocardioides nanhaiensis]|uniref:Uncharacterized protein n=1 Tax=Nocardioides nanhaiensis TaxID=1476871 RepID=A0ABP8VX12_9ACTN